MILNCVVHMINEQPLMCDIKALPTSADACLFCTNLHYIGGKKPTFADHGDSWFLVPLQMVRFVEIPARGVLEAEGGELLALPPGPVDDADEGESEAQTELLRRIREA